MFLELTLRVIVFTLTIAIGAFPACADQELCNAATTCRNWKEKSMIKTTVSASPSHESIEEDYSEYVMDVRNHVAVNSPNNEMETESGPTCTADSCSAEETSDCELVAAAQLDVETAAAAAVLAVRQSCPSLRQAAVAFIIDHHDQVMDSKGWAAARRYHPEVFLEVYRLVAEAISTPATADSQPTTEAQSQPHSDHSQTPVSATADSQPTTEAQSQPHSDHSQTPITVAPPTTPLYDIPYFRSLPAEERGRLLYQAAEDGLVEKLQALLAAGADTGFRGAKKYTALHAAATEGHVEVVRSLLEARAEMDARNDVQATPLHYAASYGHAAVITLLVGSSADPNARDRDEWTPLHYAANWGGAEEVCELLNKGADRGAKTKKGETPLDFARARKKQQQIIDLLTRSWHISPKPDDCHKLYGYNKSSNVRKESTSASTVKMVQ